MLDASKVPFPSTTTSANGHAVPFFAYVPFVFRPTTGTENKNYSIKTSHAGKPLVGEKPDSQRPHTQRTRMHAEIAHA
jgi:hypothetical protein